MDSLRKDMKWRFVGVLGKTVIDALFLSCPIRKIDEVGAAELIAGKKVIGVFWHSRILLCAYMHKGLDAAIMVSKSEDGEVIAQVIHRQGHYPVRGSSTRGGAEAMDHMAEILKSTRRIAVMIPDGPQGPRHKVQPGVISLAKKTGYPILPFTYGAKNVHIFPSWDRFLLPFPLSPCTLIYGRPVRVPEDADREIFKEKQQELETEMNRITRLADSIYGHDLIE